MSQETASACGRPTTRSRICSSTGVVVEQGSGGTPSHHLRDRNAYERVIAALYRAGMGQQDWSETLCHLARFLDARVVTLDTYDFDERRGVVLAANIEPDPAILEYNTAYGQANPLIEKARSRLTGSYVLRASDVIPLAEFVRTDLYNHVHRRMGAKCIAGVGLETGADVITQFTVVKPDRAGDFDDREIERLKAIQVHARRAYAGFRALARTQRRLDELTSLWNVIEFPVMVVGDRRRLRFANRAAEDLMRDISRRLTGPPGASRAHGLLRVPALAKALDSVFSGGGVRHAGELRLEAHPRLRATVFALGPRRAAVLLTDPLRRRNLPLGAFQQRFSLTEAEARVVQRLATGESLKQAATHIGIGYETARTQLKSAMGKNGWRRQSEILADVFSELLPFGSSSTDRLSD